MKKILYASALVCSLLASKIIEAENVSGKSFMRSRSQFQSASPEKVALSNSDALAGVKHGDKGQFAFSIFGGANTNRDDEAAYYMPYGHKNFTIDGSLELERMNSIGENYDGGYTGDTSLGMISSLFTSNTAKVASDGTNRDPGSIAIDPNKDTSIMRSWNFGIDIAALYEPQGKGKATTNGAELEGNGLLTNPEFKSTISPKLKVSQFGLGAALRYHFSDDATGFFAEASTALQRVKAELDWNENVESNRRTEGITENLAKGDPLAGVPSLDTYHNAKGATNASDGDQPTGLPVSEEPPKDFKSAFAQSTWNYGKVDGAHTETKLADIELKLGYQTVLEDTHSLNSYIGLVIPTGTKNDGTRLAPAQVGNGRHFGFMSGGSIDMQLAEDEDFRVSARCDANFRYLFKNTQTRSFDVKGKPWSRYMIVWENKEAFDTAAANAQGALDGGSLAYKDTRAYTPGINIFTKEMHVTPRAQMRCNLALLLGSEKVRGELGWNIMARQAEKVELAQAWEESPAFADPSFVYPGVNNARTLYNDALFQGNNFQFNADIAKDLTSTVTPTPVSSGSGVYGKNGDNGNGAPFGAAQNLAAITQDYNKYQINSSDLDLTSAASPSVMSHTPYVAVGYVWDNDTLPVFLNAGASYEFTFANRFTNQWQVFGKLHINF